MDQNPQKESLEDIPGLPGVEFTLSSGGSALIPVAGSTEGKRCERILDVACISGILAFYFARNERVFG